MAAIDKVTPTKHKPVDSSHISAAAFSREVGMRETGWFEKLFTAKCQEKHKHAQSENCPFDFKHKKTHQKRIRLRKKDIACATLEIGTKTVNLALLPALQTACHY